MGSHLLEDLYQASKSWLASQPDMDPWDEGCQTLTRQLGGWVESYSEPICEAPVAVGSLGQAHYLPRLWQCLSYHWEQARDKAPKRSIGVTSVVQRPLPDREVDIPAGSAASVDEDAALRESLELFAEVARDAFHRLPAADRLLLSQVYIDGLKQKDIAHLLRVDPGTVTRRLQVARSCLQQELEAVAKAKFSDTSYQDLLEQITEGHRTFAEAFCEALQRTRRDAP